MSTQPTDVEIDALWRFEASKNWDSTLAMRTGFARAVLAKWGTPSTVEVEPVARLEIGKTIGGVSLTHTAEPAAFQLPEGMYALYTAPQPTQPQAGAVPLTDEQIKYLQDDGVFLGACRQIVRAIEAAHGIKGGQHGTE